MLIPLPKSVVGQVESIIEILFGMGEKWGKGDLWLFAMWCATRKEEGLNLQIYPLLIELPCLDIYVTFFFFSKNIYVTC